MSTKGRVENCKMPPFLRGKYPFLKKILIKYFVLLFFTIGYLYICFWYIPDKVEKSKYNAQLYHGVSKSINSMSNYIRISGKSRPFIEVNTSVGMHTSLLNKFFEIISYPFHVFYTDGSLDSYSIDINCNDIECREIEKYIKMVVSNLCIDFKYNKHNFSHTYNYAYCSDLSYGTPIVVLYLKDHGDGMLKCLFSSRSRVIKEEYIYIKERNM